MFDSAKSETSAAAMVSNATARNRIRIFIGFVL